MAKTCPICGKTAFMYYPLCKECLDLSKHGDVIKCEQCGTWHKKDSPCQCNNKITKAIETSTCIICGKEAHGKKQCPSCFEETLCFTEEFNKNNAIHEFRDYYYNLKERIVIMDVPDVIRRYCNKLIAIALTAKKYCDDTSLIDRVYRDCSTLIERKKEISTSPIIKEKKKHQDEDKAKIKTAEDGHMVKSDMEVRIDDILYNNCILHCYEKSIDELPENIRRKCDWFIPILNKKGIYIEYFGMDTPEYIKRKEEKISLYKEYNIPFIAIEKDDPKNDTRGFVSNFLREIRSLAIQHYHFMPEWKP